MLPTTAKDTTYNKAIRNTASDKQKKNELRILSSSFIHLFYTFIGCLKAVVVWVVVSYKPHKPKSP